MKQTEHKLQVAVARLLDASGLLWTAIPNGGKRSAVTGAILKAEGVKAGFPDIGIFKPIWKDEDDPEGSEYSGVFIELKNGKAGRVSSAQAYWLFELRDAGYRAEVCRSLDEVIALLRECYPDKFP